MTVYIHAKDDRAKHDMDHDEDGKEDLLLFTRRRRGHRLLLSRHFLMYVASISFYQEQCVLDEKMAGVGSCSTTIMMTTTPAPPGRKW